MSKKLESEIVGAQTFQSGFPFIEDIRIVVHGYSFWSHNLFWEQSDDIVDTENIRDFVSNIIFDSEKN